MARTYTETVTLQEDTCATLVQIEAKYWGCFLLSKWT